MKLTCLSSLLFALFVTGARAADGDLNAKCKTTTPACTDSNASCQSDVCKCNPNFVQSGSKCVPVVGMPCGRGQCLTYGVCSDSDLCACDSDKGFQGASGASTCTCPSTHALQDGKCLKKIGQTCAAGSECYVSSGIICDSTCKCDVNKGWATASAGATSCSCDTTKAAATSVDGKCLLKVGQACSTTADCIQTDGMVCGDRSGQTKCTCDTNKNYAAGADGDVTCSCAANHFLKSDKTCGKVIGQVCAASSECIDGAVCKDDSGTLKCLCDTDNNFAAGSAGATSCACATNYALKADGTCGLKTDQTCTTTSQCIDNAVCIDDSGTLKCKCDTTKHFATAAAAAACACDTTKADSTPVNGVCPLKVGQPCSTASDCIETTGMICADVSGTTKCTCDTTKGFLAGADGATTCSCDTSKAASSPNDDGICPLKVGQVCTAAAECIDTDGMLCADRSGTVKCTCNTTANYAAGSDGASTCSCAANHAKKQDKTCGLVIGQACTADGTPCIDGAICDPVTSKCICDTGNGYATGTTGATACTCQSTYVATAWGCGKKVGQACSDTCSANAACDDTVGYCACKSGSVFVSETRTCRSGGTAVVSSFTAMVVGILLALGHI